MPHSLEEYDGQTFTQNEEAKIIKLVKSDDLMVPNIVLLAQLLMKNRSWNIGKGIYEKETCVFCKLEKTLRIVKLEQVLRCSNKVFGVTKSTQIFVWNEDSIYKTEMDEVTSRQQQNMVSNSLLRSNQPEVGTSRIEQYSCPIEDSRKTDESVDFGKDLDQAFQRLAPAQRRNAWKSKIVSKFGFLCEPRQGVDIGGWKPNLVEFSKDIDLASNIAVISLALTLKSSMFDKKTTTVLHMTDEQPKIVTFVKTW